MASTQSKIHNSHDDPFDSLLTLEDTLYTTAYQNGSSAGSRAGRIEGRIFGLEQGFEKFASLGELHGRSVIWGARALNTTTTTTTASPEAATSKENEKTTLPGLKQSARLTNNITLLHSLSDPLTFSTDNTEEAVADFDDRVKRAGAKAKVIERIVGEMDGSAASKSPDGKGRAGGGVRLNEKKKADDSMEDFVAGARVLR